MGSAYMGPFGPLLLFGGIAGEVRYVERMLNAYAVQPFGEVSPAEVMAAAGVVTAVTGSIDNLAKSLANLKLDVNVALPPTGQLLAQALPPVLITVGFLTATAFLVSAVLKRTTAKTHVTDEGLLLPGAATTSFAGKTRRRRRR